MEENLKELIRLYYNDKQELDQYKKSTEEYNKDIKDAMRELGYDKFETDDYVAKVTTQKRESFIDEKLIAKLKELNVTTPIKTVEVIDFDELENVIYNGQLDVSELTNCKQVKEVVTLKVSERKSK
jgi:predicted acetyltransferase